MCFCHAFQITTWYSSKGRELGILSLSCLTEPKLHPKQSTSLVLNLRLVEADSEQELKHAVKDSNTVSLENISDVILSIGSEFDIMSNSNVCC